MTRSGDNNQEGRDKRWFTRENVLMSAGLLLVAATFVAAEIGWAFHYEFLIGGLALCGVSITSIGDKK